MSLGASEKRILDNKEIATQKNMQKQAFHDANVCLFVFDCLHYNGESLMNRPLKDRRSILHKNMVEIPNRIMFSEMHHITRESDKLADLMMKVFREGLEGLVLKDLNGVYEPGKRHWLKVKKDYLAQGAMADTADLVVLGAYFGTGSKGGMMSIFLMGAYDPATSRWCTVTKCGIGFDDKTLEQLQKDLKVVKISKDVSRVPAWLNVNKALVPDFVMKDPKDSPVWEITGAEFSQSETHTAKGISIRFPRCTKVRDDKTWKEATNLPRLQLLYEKSKEYSDIPNPLGMGSSSRPTNASPSKKRSTATAGSATPTKHNSSTSVVDSDDDDDSASGSSASTLATPVKRNATPVKQNATPVKRNATPVKRNTSHDTDESPSKKSRETKLPCKYGMTCYQKNPEHLANYDHSGKGAATPQNKATGLPEVFTGTKFYLPETLPESGQLRRYVIAFGGELVDEFHKSSADYIVTKNGKSGVTDERFVTVDWLRRCIKKKEVVPRRRSKPS